MIDRNRATNLLDRIQDGQETAEPELLTLLYDQLRSVASRLLADERHNHTLQPTALVHEAWVRLIDQDCVSGDVPEAERRFVGLASRAMRQVLVDHARRNNSQKRGGKLDRVTLPDGLPVTSLDPAAVLDLESALESLTGRSERTARMAELRLYGGLSVAEAATTLGISLTSAKVEWQLAQAMLTQHLRDRT